MVLLSFAVVIHVQLRATGKLSVCGEIWSCAQQQFMQLLLKDESDRLIRTTKEQRYITCLSTPRAMGFSHKRWAGQIEYTFNQQRNAMG